MGKERTSYHLTPDGWIQGEEDQRPPATVLTATRIDEDRMYVSDQWYVAWLLLDDDELVYALREPRPTAVAANGACSRA